MGYLFLSVSVLSGAIKGFFAKKISDKTADLKSAALSNFTRMLFCIPIGLLFVAIDGSLAKLAVSGEVLIIACFSGISTAAFIVFWLLAVQKSAYTAMDAFLSMGTIIPILLSLAIFGEEITLSQILGLLLLIGAVCFMSAYTNQIKGKLSIVGILLLIIVSIANGVTDFTQKLFSYNAADTPASVFNFYVYVFSAAILFVLYVCLKHTPKEDGTVEGRVDLDRKKLSYIAIMAVFLFCNSYFKTLAAGYLSAAQIYPFAQGVAIILSLLMSAIFFKEKIKPLCIVGLIVLFVGLLLLNVIMF